MVSKTGQMSIYDLNLYKIPTELNTCDHKVFYAREMFDLNQFILADDIKEKELCINLVPNHLNLSFQNLYEKRFDS